MQNHIVPNLALGLGEEPAGRASDAPSVEASCKRLDMICAEIVANLRRRRPAEELSSAGRASDAPARS